MSGEGSRTGLEVAIVGLAGRFPGADDVAAFWRNLIAGVSSVVDLSTEKLIARGVDPARVADPSWVKAAAEVSGADLFDARFFDVSPREAEVLDPQHRLFLEACWAALEDAGIDPARDRRPIGVFAGSSVSSYYFRNVLSSGVDTGALGGLLGADKDHLTTLVSWKLDLSGPSFAIQSACSTSLVAVHVAAQSLLNGECDAALAGGVSILFPQGEGYPWSEGGILSRDGRCRSFDEQGAGTIFGSGLGVVVLKRLDDAIRDGDRIRAVIKGSAVTNDGGGRLGYTAPSAAGQAKTIRAAQLLAEVEPETIGFVEGHSTATQLGDPIEVAALAETFGRGRPGSTALGSVKSNIGHLNAAAGIAGLIKAVLAVESGEVPPTLHFERPNPQIDLARGPFFVNTEPTPFPALAGEPRRAAVSSFGMGGTNAHAILEQAPPAPASGPSREFPIVVLSARSAAALDAATERLAAHLAARPGPAAEELADVAYTAALGRKAFSHRRAVVVDAATGFAAAREGAGSFTASAAERPVYFLFPGQGAQYLGMGEDLYRGEPVFRAEIDRATKTLDLVAGHDLRDVLFARGKTGEERAAAEALLGRTEWTQVALFAVETALARLWLSWGVEPAGMIGHSVGEYVAAHLAGVFSFEDALRLVALRGRLMQSMPEGAMLAVPRGERWVAARLAEGWPALEIAAINAPESVVVAGPAAEIERFRIEIAPDLPDGSETRRLHTSHAFHSAAMEPILEEFERAVAAVVRKAPERRFVSNRTGRWILSGEATDPAYWAAHLRHAVRFADGLSTLGSEGDAIYLEVGPGHSLGTLARRQPALAGAVLASLRHPKEEIRDAERLARTVAELWARGGEIDWWRYFGSERRRKVELPTYPFERQRFFLEARPGFFDFAPGPIKPASLAGVAGPRASGDAPPQAGAALHQRPALATAYVAPRTDDERRIAAIWSDLFGVAEVGANDNFFDLGGHSLLATRVVSRIREACGVELPLDALFETPTIAALARAVEERRSVVETDLKDGKDIKDLGTVRAIAEREPRETRLPGVERPMSFAQERLWLLDRLVPDNAFYTLGSAQRLTQRVDVPALSAALREVVRRHETLRASFDDEDGRPRMTIHPTVPVRLPEADLAALPYPRRGPEAERLTAVELHRPFDLARPPLAHFVLLHLAPADHALIYSFHHIASDGWSLGVFGRELLAIYSTSLAGRPSPLPPLPVSYSDVATRQRERFARGEIDRQIAFWRERLASAPITELPADRPRPPVPSHRGVTLRSALGAEVFGPLARLARSRAGSPFMGLLGAFYALVARYACQTDLVVGVPIAGRSRSDEEPLIGFFVNNLILRADLSGDPSFGEIFDRTKTLALDAYSHQDVPFERLVEELSPRRDLARNPLFQLMFNLMPVGEDYEKYERLGGLLALRSGAAPFDLQVYLFEAADRVNIGWEYATDLFEASTIERLAGHYRNLLAGAAAHPEARLSDLPLLAAAERAELLLAGAGPVVAAPAETVPARFAAQAIRTPAAPAVVTAEEILDYATLGARVERLARHLAALGIGVEAKVGIAVDRSAALPVAALGVLAAGASYVPLDPGYPAERLAYMAADAGLAALIVEGEGTALPATLATLAAAHPAVGAVVELTAGGEVVGEPAASQGNELPPLPLPENLAYTIYTSGSTGRPKGVELSHCALASFLAAMIERPGIGAADVLVAVTSLSFDIAGLELYAPLLVGGRIVIARRDVVADGRLLADLLATSGATILQATPSGWRVLLASGWAGAPGLKALVGGEALPPALAAELRPKVSALWNMYGPTETAVWSALDRVGEGAITIGRPVPGTQSYVVDAAGELLPKGVPGELRIGGAGVARGYHARPDLTAERFLPDPFSSAPGARLYRTGDLARFLPDGRIEILGRIDHQVKIRGHRIELGEIENALAEVPGVAAAAAIVFGDGEERRIAAYVVERSGVSLGEGAALRETLGAHLRDRLPEAFVPSTFTRLDRLPLTPNGKVDKRALPSPELPGAEALAPPRTPTEKRLAGFWQELLGVAAVGIESHFFQLGGHSLLGMRLVARVREELGLELPLRRLFEAPTLGALAAAIDRGDDTGVGERDLKDGKDLKEQGKAAVVEAALAAPVLRPRRTIAPLSFAQQRLWVLDRLTPGNPFYNLGGAVRLSGPLDRGALHASVREIGRRHDTLRTRFAEIGGEAVQIVEPDLVLRTAEIDLAGLGQTLGDAELLRLSRAQLALSFDLGAAPLLRSWLLGFSPREHALVYAMHHIVSDGWSMGLLFGEVAQIYGARRLGRPSPLPPLPLQYADFAVEQRAWFAGGELERQLGFWRERLAALPASELPTDRPRPAVLSHRGRTLSTAIGADLVARLETLGRVRSASTFMVLLAGFQALVARYVGEGDSVLGTPVANRTRTDVEGLIGFFVNTLVLRTSMAGDPTFGEAIERAKASALGAFAHQDLPFERLVEELAPRRDLSRNPLFQLMFNLVNTPFEGGAAGDLAMTAVPVSAETALVDLQLYLRLSPSGLGIRWEYATDLFEGATIERLARHYENLLAGAVERPAARLFDLPLLSASERAELLAAGTGAGAGMPAEASATVPGLFAAQALSTPFAAAVVDGATTLDYATLRDRVNRLARRLIALGLRREAKVGIAVERSAALPVAALGVLAAGASYVPLDPGYPAERLAYMAADAGLAALIVDAEPSGDAAALATLASLRTLAPFTVALGADGTLGDEAGAPESGGDLAPRALPEGLAYTIYTSGSTGKPKGVELSHGALANFLAAMIERPGVGADDVFVASTSLSFDIAGLELYAPLLVGARIAIARRDEVADGRLLANRLAASGATIFQATPSGWRVLLASGWAGDPKLKALVGGEALPPALAAELLPKVAELWNMYGPTETAVWSTLDRVEEGPITIGRPIAATVVAVVDAHKNPLPWGVPGELLIGGAGVARGYRGRPDLTAERFLPDPFSEVAGARTYSTGDLARFLPDGRLEALGRIDHQVKVRGHRIELQEIEQVLSRHPGVAQAAATVFGDGEDKRIAAYVVERSGASLGVGTALRETLLSFLRGRLPEPMIPSSFSRLDKLPLTSSGKVDRKALPAPESTAGLNAAEAPPTPPRNPIEELLAGIWQDLLGLENVGVESHFFDLGGHSLLAMRLVSRVREVLGVELPLRRVFEAPDLGRLTAAIEQEGMEHILGGSGALGAEIPPLEPQARGASAPLSFAQERLWFLEQLQPGTSAYNVSSSVTFDGDLDVASLRGALDEIVRRHEMLRTRFAVEAGRPVQVVEPPLPFPFEEVDLAGTPEEERIDRAEHLAYDAAHLPFDLGSAPLVRALLVRLAERSFRLTVAMHHLATDGWSNEVILQEIAALYPARLEKRPSPLSELPVQYADYSLWQRGWLQGDALERQLGYWRTALSGAPPLLELPLDRPRPAVQRFDGKRERFEVSAPLADALRGLGRARGTTPFMTLLAAFDALLSRIANVDDVVVGTPIAGRNRREVESLVGFFVNTLALRTDLSGDPTFAELLARVRGTTLSAYAHQDVPFERIVEDLAPERSRAHSPIFQVHLVVDAPPAAAAAPLPGLVIRPLGQALEISKFDLTLMVVDGGAGRPFYAQLRYNVELFEPATVARMGERFLRLLEQVSAAPEVPLSRVDLLLPAERRALLTDVSGVAGLNPPPASGRSIAELFLARAAARPEALAILFEQERTTYGELAVRARRLAQHLSGMGVGPEVLVGLFLERSPRLVEAMLAVWLAGGAYLPLDPTLPAERSGAMIRDAGVPILIGEESLLDEVPEHAAWVIDLDAIEPLLASAPAADAPIPAVDPDQLAYVIYTSGSTGKPKGVAVTHRGLENLARQQGEMFDVVANAADGGPEPRVLQFASSGFDASVSEIAVALTNGAALVMAGKGSILPGFELYTLLRDRAISNVTLPPSALAALPADKPLPALRSLVVAGEACPIDLALTWSVSRKLVNAYGPTENTVCIAMHAFVPGSGRLPLGRPIPGVDAYVLDRQGELAPAGTPGELAVGGIALARGYLGAPDLTAERFVPHPFAADPGRRLYRTGDLVRWGAGGDLEFLGRIDTQVKVRGFRIELGEIERALFAHPRVQEAVVVARAEGGTEKRLIAYVVPRPDAAESTGPLDASELRAFLSRTLPEYMIPAAIATLPALPKNASGKVERRALPDPREVGAAEREIAAPRNPLETFLVGLFAETLHVDVVGIDDNFFELGGNSIAGAMLVNRLQEELGEIVHVVVMFEAPTIEGLAAFLIENYPQALARRFGMAAGAAGEGAGPIDEQKIAAFTALVPVRRPVRLAGGRKNPGVAFVLSPPRSGSTLFRVMLAGHPLLFAPPELELLPYDDLRERRDDFPGRYNHFLEGAVRAVMELDRLSAAGAETAEAAEAKLDAWEQEGISMAEVFARLQKAAEPRLLVDKTPGYSLHPSILARAEQMFEGARYIHLIRHPYGMIRSFEEAKLDQVFFRSEHSFTRRELAELIWLVSHRNILAFFESIPAERKHAVVFEELLAEPERVLRGVCAFLGIDYQPDMAAPYQASAEKQSARMTDGLHSWSRMVGDVKFHEHGRIERGVADRWKNEIGEDFLGEPTRDMAETLGFARREAGWVPLGPAGWREGEELPLSFAQERLWFLHQLDPASTVYNIPTALRLAGDLSVPALRAALAGLLARHAALRTRFASRDGGAVQIVEAETAPSLPQIDLAALAADGPREAELSRLAFAESTRPFDLTRAPLLRAALIRLAANDHAGLFAMHHIASDGWSAGILAREIGALYAAARAGLPALAAAGLPALPIQYPDYAIWQRRWLAGSTLDAELGWWRREIAGVPALELAGDRPRPPVVTIRGATRGLAIPADRLDGFDALAREEGASAFMILLAAFSALLGRLAGQQEFLLGTPVANRSRAQVEGLIGFFVNTLALRADLSGAPTFRELVRRTRASVLDAFAHQDVPFEKIVEAVQPARDLSRPPLFQVMMLLQNAPGGALTLPGLALTPVAFERRTSKFDLTLFLNQGEAGLFTGWEFNFDLFDPTTIGRLAERFAHLLACAGAEPDRPLAELPATTPSERHQTLLEWNDVAAGYSFEVCLHRLFEAQVERTPEALAIVDDETGEELSYADLDARANRLARHLAALGVDRSARVAIAVERSAGIVVAILGTMKAGAAYVPLDPSYPVDRLAFMLADSAAAVLIVDLRSASSLPPFAGPKVRIDDPAIARRSARRLAVASRPDDLAYVIYTSGSTGRPKGVMVAHAPVANCILYMQERMPLVAADRLLQKTPYGFDASVWEFFWPLIVGAQLVIARPDGHRDPAYLVRVIRARAVTVLQAVPSLLEVFVSEPGVEECRSLRQIYSGGEALSADLLARLLDLGAQQTYNVYGPTEATMHASMWRASRQADKAPIGRPVGNARFYVVDALAEPTGLGVAGELWIGGEVLALGYWERADLTAERFLPDPWSGTPGARVYRTGDLVRHLPDGNLAYLGRIDHQVKLRGQRIEPGEIEAQLRRHPAVGQVVVVLLGADRGGAQGEPRLVAYVVPSQGAAPEASELRAFLAAGLPDTMVPKAFVMLDLLPTMPSGKVDLKALPAPDPAAAEIHQGARTPTEEIVAAIWCEVLDRAAVGVAEDFFALGGHSLLATRVGARIRAAFGIELPLRALFEATTIERLARVIEAARAGGDGEEGPALVAVPRDGRHLPLSLSQQRLWFLYALMPESPAYNLPLFFRLLGDLSVAALRASLAGIVRRHEVLRTTLGFDDGSVGEGSAAAGNRGLGDPGQRIAPASAAERIAALPVVDLAALAAARREAEASRQVFAEARRPFDLERGPLLRAALLRLGASEHVGLFNLHHAVSDDWSRGVFVRELSALYGAALTREPVALPTLPVQFADFALWQRSALAAAAPRRLAAWRAALAGAPLVLDLPTDRPRPAALSFRGAPLPVLLSPGVEAGVRALARSVAASPFMVLLTGFAALLGRLAGQDDLLIGSAVAGRSRLELEGLIGFFINTLVLRARPRAGIGFADLVGEVRANVLDSYAEQDLPFERLVEELNPPRDPSRSPLFQAVFDFQTAAVGVLALPGVELQAFPGGSRTAKNDLSLHLEDRNPGAGFAGVFEYSTDLFEEATIGRWAGHLETLLAAALAGPNRSVGDLPLLAESERAEIVAAWSRSEAPVAVAPCTLAALFEDSADRFAELAAVVIGDRELSYAQLDARANQLAHHLRAFGVGPEVAVGVFCDPSFDLAVGLLGIAKAGGVYVPLDPQLPLERLSFMIEDAGLAILLTQEHFQKTLPALPAFAIVLDGAGWDLVATSPESRPEPVFGREGEGESALDSLAYVIYTSGSTGRPKGVGVTHRGIANLGRELARLTAVEPGDRILQFSSIGFDASICEVAEAWSTGAALVFAGREQRMPGAGLARLLVEQRITLVTLPPSALAALPDLPEGVPAALMVAGEACPPDLAERWRQGRRFVDAYGPTETTVCSSAHLYEGGRLTIGRSIAGFESYVLGSAGAVQPLGVPGELLLGGASLARGYRGRPDLTAERFVPHPFATEGSGGARLYRTGDLARWIAVDRGGAAVHELEFLGRIDHQVKIRGFRIELGEIETVLAALPGVREAAVLARPAGGGDLRLIAYVAATEPHPEPAEWKEALRAKLPNYMVPAMIGVLDDLPKNAAGKVDRRALAGIDPARIAADVEHLAPQTDVEVVLAGIWCEVLDRERIGIDEDFFDIGGHSLLATKVVARVQKVFRIDLELRDFFAATTIEAAARTLIAKEKQPGMTTRAARLLRQIQEMSAEERQALLAGTPAHEGAEDA